MIPALLALGLACGPKAPTPSPPPPAAAPAAAPDLVYFVMVDRFANGDPSNDGEVDPADPQAFHGGDLHGVIDRLDHLEALGVKTVWLSPIFAMRTEKIAEHGAFHGYWVHDPWRVEPRFGDEATLRVLSDALHARGMRLVLDMVWNHVAYDSPVRAAHPDWFHGLGDITDWNDPFQLVHHDVHGLPDLAQEKPEVAAWLREVSLHWARVADGFRIDAVRHLPTDFIAETTAALRAQQGEDFVLLAEDFQGDVVGLAANKAAGGYDQVFDFPLRYALVDSVCHGRPLGRVAATLALDRLYDDPDGLVTFLDNHDLPRVATECGGDRDKVALALGLMFTLRGTPMVSWGTEWAVEGAGEPENRADAPWGQEAVLGLTLRTLARWRRSFPALVEGSTAVLELQDHAILLARHQPGQVALVALNLGEQDAVLDLPEGLDGDVVYRAHLAGAGPAFELRGPGLERRWVVPPGQLRLVVLSPTDRSALRTQGPAPARLTVTGAPAGPGDQVVAVGAGPELGHWDPARGVVLECVDGTCRGALPVHGVAEWKLVVRRADGAASWEPGENRYTRGGEVEARWR